MSRGRIVFIDPMNVPDSRYLALALQGDGWKIDFHTSFELRSSSRLLKMSSATWFGAGAGDWLGRMVYRRRRPQFDDLQIRNWYFPDILGRLGKWVSPGAGYLLHLEPFDLLARRLVKQNVVAVVVRQAAAKRFLKLARSWGIPSVLITSTPDPVEEHEIVRQEEASLGLKSRHSDRLVRRIQRRIREEYALADWIMAPSEFAAKSIRATTGRDRDDVVTIPLAVDPPEVEPIRHGPACSGSLCILYVGSIAPRKGVHHLVRAATVLVEEGLSVQLELVGPCEDREYRRLLDRMAEPYVHIRGSVSHHLLDEYYRKADVFVLPSVCDAFGMVVTEAMARALPVIITERVGATVRDGQDGFIVPVGDVEALKASLLQLAMRPDLRERMGMEAFESARSYSWFDYGRRAADWFTSNVLAESPRR